MAAGVTPLETYERNAESAAGPSDPGATKCTLRLCSRQAPLNGSKVPSPQPSVGLVAALLILGVGIGEVAVLLANWLTFAK